MTNKKHNNELTPWVNDIGNGAFVPFVSEYDGSDGRFPLDIHFSLRATQTYTGVTSDVVVNDRQLQLTSPSGFSDGVEVVLVALTSDNFYLGEVVGAPSGSTITLDTPFDVNLSASNVGVYPVSWDMNVDGSSTSQIFSVSANRDDEIIHITRITGIFEDGAAMDDSKFGGDNKTN